MDALTLPSDANPETLSTWAYVTLSKKSFVIKSLLEEAEDGENLPDYLSRISRHLGQMDVACKVLSHPYDGSHVFELVWHERSRGATVREWFSHLRPRTLTDDIALGIGDLLDYADEVRAAELLEPSAVGSDE